MPSNEATERLNLPFIMPSQAQKHVTHNEALVQLDRIIHPVAVSRAVAVPPTDAADGACYIVAPAATGAWAGHAGDLANAEGTGWTFLHPPVGFSIFVQDEQAFVHFTGSHWQEESVSSSSLELDSLALNTEIDPLARLAVGSDTVIFSHDAATPGTGSMRIQANKAQPSDTASLIFQTEWSGRAEIGLCGNDDLAFKVSADGSAWGTALTLAPGSGRVRAPAGFTVGSSLQDTSDLVVSSPSPKMTLRDTVNVGKMHTGFVNWVDGNGTEKVWCGLGSAGNTLFSFLSQYPDGIAFYAYGGNYPIEFRQGINGSDVRLRVHTNGYIGVNNKEPTAPLHVGGAVRIGSSSVASLPAPSALGEGAILFVNDEAGGPTLAFSDGSNWRRVQDRAVVA